MCPAASKLTEVNRRRWSFAEHGDGVGFRPFVYRLTHRHHVQANTRNDNAGVTFEAQGTAVQLERFARALEVERPPLASFNQITSSTTRSQPEAESFYIESSRDPGAPRAAATWRITPRRQGFTFCSRTMAASLRTFPPSSSSCGKQDGRIWAPCRTSATSRWGPTSTRA